MSASPKHDMLHPTNPLKERQDIDDQPIGRLLQELRGLSDQQLSEIVNYQRQHGLRFGEAAVELRMATNEDIVTLLSRQFHYPYSAESDISPTLPDLLIAANPFSEGAEVFRDLRTQLLMDSMRVESSGRALAVVSSKSGDGKTFIAANLAIAFSQLGGNTLLIDANMRQPRLAEMFAIPQDALGLSSILSGRAVKYAVQQVNSLPSLFVLPAGPIPPNPQELLQRPAFKALLEELRKTFDHIIIDTPASENAADFRMIVALTDVVMTIARQDKTPVDALRRLLTVLEHQAKKSVGIVLNKY